MSSTGQKLPKVYEPRAELCELHITHPDSERPATIYCPGCKKSMCDECLECH
jgi:hypothetical protein